MPDNTPVSRPPPVVLLVDAHEDCRVMYRHWLQDCCGFLVHEADSVAEALRLAARVFPDVIATELTLPGTDGYELCRHVRRSAPTSGVRLIAVTASAMRDQIERASQAGCERVLAKPCSPQTLSGAIREVLSLT